MIATPYVQVVFIILCGALYSKISFAQLNQPNRYELERKFSDEDFTIISLKKEGLALIRETNKYKSGNRNWEIVLLDTLLHEKEKMELEMDNQNRFIAYDYSPGKVHFLFIKNEIKGNMDLLSLDLESKKVDRHEIKPELTFQLGYFSRAGENFIFGGVVSGEPAILLYNPPSFNLKILPGFFQKHSELLHVQVNQNQTFNALLMDRSNRDNQRLVFRTYDSFGTLLLEYFTIVDNNIELHTGITSTLEKEDLIVLGSWGKMNSKQVSGLYALPINPFNEQKISVTYFGQLTHYLDYLKPRKISVIKENTLRDLEEGKTPDFTSNIVPYKIIEYSQGFLLVAESFTPTSNYNQQQVTGYYPNSSTLPYYGYRNPYPNRANDRYPTTYEDNVLTTQEIKSIQASVISFDASGSVQWDQSIKFDDLKISSMEQIADILLTEDSIHFLYKKESEIKTKTINLDDHEAVEKSEKIKLNSKLDELRMERLREGFVKYWFDKSFYVWGYQTIRNKSNNEFKTREVFYINKVVVN